MGVRATPEPNAHESRARTRERSMQKPRQEDQRAVRASLVVNRKDGATQSLETKTILNLQADAGNAAVSLLVGSAPGRERGASGAMPASRVRASPPAAQRLQPLVVAPGLGVTRQSATATPPAASTSPPGPAPDPAQQAQLLRASTTLRRVQPLAAGDQALLERSIPAAPVYALMQERDGKRRDLQQQTAALQQARASVGTHPEHGVPATEEDVTRMTGEVEALTRDVERLDGLVRAALAPLGLSSEAELAELLTRRFPSMFLERAKQIALTELESNRAIAEAEIHRYGLDACVDPAARQALRAAAADLLARDRRIGELQNRLQQARSGVEAPSGGVPDPGQAGSSQYDVNRLTEELERAGREREVARDRHALQHPILLRQVDLQAIATGNDAALEAAVGGPLREILQNIDQTQQNIRSGRLKVWNLNDIVQMASQDLGVTGNPVLEEVVRQRIAAEQSDEADVRIALAALAITAGLIATFATGGLALGAAAVALGVGGYQASESVQNFMSERAAGNVALDPRVADISRNEPELGWLVLDLVGVGLDALQVVQAVNQLRQAARAARETGAVVEFTQAARRALPAEAANRVIASITRQQGAASGVGRTVEAIGNAFRHADLAEIGRQIDQIADRGFHAVFENLRSQGRVLPLTEGSLRAALGNETASALIADSVLANDGFFHQVSRQLFIKPGRLESVTSTVVHEATHWIQTTQHAGFELFMEEYQAFAMEQRYLRNLIRTSGSLDAVPSELVWLVGANEERIAQHVIDNYPGAVRPAGFDGAAAVEDVMRRLRAFH
jgi:hypothetical protein